MLLLQREWIARVGLGLPGWPLTVVSPGGRLIERVVACDRWNGLLLAEPGEPIPFAVTALREDKHGVERVEEMRRWCRRHAKSECYVLPCHPWVRAFFQDDVEAALFRMQFDN